MEGDHAHHSITSIYDIVGDSHPTSPIYWTVCETSLNFRRPSGGFEVGPEPRPPGQRSPGRSGGLVLPHPPGDHAAVLHHSPSTPGRVPEKHFDQLWVHLQSDVVFLFSVVSSVSFATNLRCMLSTSAKDDSSWEVMSSVSSVKEKGHSRVLTRLLKKSNQLMTVCERVWDDDTWVLKCCFFYLSVRQSVHHHFKFFILFFALMM